MIKKPDADRHAEAASELFDLYGQCFESAHVEQRTRHAPYPANQTFKDGFVSGAALAMCIYEAFGKPKPTEQGD